MFWLLALHIMALLFWSATLLYLPALIASSRHRALALDAFPGSHDSLARFFYTRIASPPALLAIMAGTLLFVLDRNTSPWLILKLTLVAGLAVCHVLTGELIRRLEDEPNRAHQPWCGLLSVMIILLLLAITWLVLAKPQLEWSL